jgi:hypothetical protein
MTVQKCRTCSNILDAVGRLAKQEERSREHEFQLHGADAQPVYKFPTFMEGSLSRSKQPATVRSILS